MATIEKSGRPSGVILERGFIVICFSDLLEPGRVECELCRVMCASVLEMREHLNSEQHMIKERRLFTDNTLEKDMQALSLPPVR